MFRDFREGEDLPSLQFVPTGQASNAALADHTAREATISWLRANTQAAAAVDKPSFLRRALREHGDALISGLGGFLAGSALLLPGVLLGTDFALVTF